jgi:hypothetical protein
MSTQYVIEPVALPSLPVAGDSRRFAVNLDIHGVPTGHDFRVDMDANTVDMLRKQIEEIKRLVTDHFDVDGLLERLDDLARLAGWSGRSARTVRRR